MRLNGVTANNGWNWCRRLPAPDPAVLAEFGQLAFLDGLRAWYRKQTDTPLTNYLLAEIAMVSQNTIESWRTAPGCATHRPLSTRDRVLILFRLARYVENRPIKPRPRGNASAPRWSPAEDQLICLHYPSAGPAGMMERLPGRTANAIALQASRLGIAKPRKKRA
ncbi:hypothetical protein ABH313_21815 [Chromobacterium vaccinii]|uniref:hypothetical protein n=1 Tax=Chromobacterium vaccinii TaxID=1108595 RepID=UPI0032600731